jgi:hypothetical protein
VQTGEETNVATHSKYVSPDISHDGRSVLAVNMHPEGGSNVIVMNTDGMVTDSLPLAILYFPIPNLRRMISIIMWHHAMQ